MISIAPHGQRNFDCIVIGSGIAGVSAALHIQRTGATVAIADPDPPGSGSSSGNAGIVVNTKLLPVFAGMTPGSLLAMLRDPASPLEMRWGAFPGMVPWFLRMLRHAGPAEVERIARALSNLCQPGARNYAALWEEAGMGDLVQARGSVALYLGEAAREQHWNSRGYGLLRSMGVPMERVGPPEVRELAAGVDARFTHGIYSPDFHHTVDQRAYVGKLFDLFRSRGGTGIAERVARLTFADGTVSGIETPRGKMPAGSVVVAANTGSARLAKAAGEPVPHQAVGGYHITLEAPGILLRTPILPMDFRVAITPMNDRIRVAGIYEFGGQERPIQRRLFDKMLDQVSKVLPGIDTSKRTEGRNFRSYLPDALPVISRSSRHQGLFYLFGLASSGMINGATAGKVLSQLWSGATPDFDMTPYSIDRF